MTACILKFMETLKKFPTMINRKLSISANNDGNAADIIYVGELEILSVLMYHCATYSLWPGPVSYCSVFGPYCKNLGHPCCSI